MSDSPDVQLQLKKRARRRLVGAIAIAGLAAVVLPMVMDEEPKQQVQDVQIRIPGQDQTPFTPKLGKPPVAGAASEKAVVPAEPLASAAPAAEVSPSKPADKAVEKRAEKPVEKHAEKPVEKPVEKHPEKHSEKPAEKPAEKKTEKVHDKAADKPALKPAEKPAEKPAKPSESKAGDSVHSEAGHSDGGQYLILIGAFSNPGNVKQLQAKIGELGIKVITEPVELPDGPKTRVRAGPFASREAADKALDKMKRIGVGGVVAAKQ